MADPDLEQLRSFRADEADPPAGMQGRIEERLWRSIMAEESQAASRRSGVGRRWFDGILRPAVATGFAATIAVGVALAGGGTGTGGTGTSTSVARQAGVLDSTASALFGEPAGTAAASAPIHGAIDLTSPDEPDDGLARGPILDGGELDDATLDVIRDTPRDPVDLQARLRASAAAAGGSDPSDRVAFHMAMRWVIAPQVPTDLRAAILRSLDGLSGLDGAITGVDLLGRSGVVLGHLDPVSGLRSQYLLDIDDARLLEQRSFTTGYVDPACPPGTFTSHALRDDVGKPVTSSDAPWLNWPVVVTACDPTELAAAG